MGHPFFSRKGEWISTILQSIPWGVLIYLSVITNEENGMWHQNIQIQQNLCIWCVFVSGSRRVEWKSCVYLSLLKLWWCFFLILRKFSRFGFRDSKAKLLDLTFLGWLGISEWEWSTYSFTALVLLFNTAFLGRIVFNWLHRTILNIGGCSNPLRLLKFGRTSAHTHSSFKYSWLWGWWKKKGQLQSETQIKISFSDCISLMERRKSLCWNTTTEQGG